MSEKEAHAHQFKQTLFPARPHQIPQPAEVGGPSLQAGWPVPSTCNSMFIRILHQKCVLISLTSTECRPLPTSSAMAPESKFSIPTSLLSFQKDQFPHSHLFTESHPHSSTHSVDISVTLPQSSAHPCGSRAVFLVGQV